MARFTHLLPFSPLYEFQASKPVTINGVGYQPGDRITNEARDTLGARRLQKLYEARQVTPIPPEALPAVLQPKEGAFVGAGKIDPADGEMATAEAADGVSLPEGTTGAVIEPDTGVKIEHRGFGRWYATMPDGTEQGPMTKEQAEALLTV